MLNEIGPSMRTRVWPSGLQYHRRKRPTGLKVSFHFLLPIEFLTPMPQGQFRGGVNSSIAVIFVQFPQFSDHGGPAIRPYRLGPTLRECHDERSTPRRRAVEKVIVFLVGTCGARVPSLVSFGNICELTVKNEWINTQCAQGIDERVRDRGSG